MRGWNSAGSPPRRGTEHSLPPEPKPPVISGTWQEPVYVGREEVERDCIEQHHTDRHTNTIFNEQGPTIQLSGCIAMCYIVRDVGMKNSLLCHTIEPAGIMEYLGTSWLRKAPGNHKVEPTSCLLLDTGAKNLFFLTILAT